MLVGNKYDLGEAKRVVSVSEVSEKAKQEGFSWFETSAVLGANKVESSFNCLVYKVIQPCLLKLKLVKEVLKMSNAD